MLEAIKLKNPFRVEGKVVWITLTQGKETCVDLSDWPEASRYRWYAHKGRRTYYATSGGGSGRHLVRLHTLLCGKGSDHWDTDGLNNLRANLRPATARQNLANSRKRIGTSSQFKGVHKHRDGKWAAQIAHTHVGLFSEETEAAKAYDEKAKELFGEFARLNFPEASC